MDEEYTPFDDFLDILDENNIDFDDLNLDPNDLVDMDADDLNNLLAQIELPDEEDEIEIYMGDPDDEEEEED